MTDGGQEATQEPEPITPDNNFPKASFPSSTSTGKPPIHIYIYIYVYIYTHTRARAQL